MEQQSGKNPGGDGRVRGAFGDNAIGNRMSDSNGVGDIGGGNAGAFGDSAIEISMRDSNSVGDSGGGNAAMTIDATGIDGASGGDGAQTLQQLMATILRDAWQGDGAAAGSGNVNRDDVWEEQQVGRLARGRSSKLAEQ